MKDWGLAPAVVCVACTLHVASTFYVVSGCLTAVAVAKAVNATVSAQKYTFEEVASGLKHHDPATRIRAIQILKDADYAQAVVPIAATLHDSDDRVQLAGLDAERSLLTTRPMSRRRKIGFVVEQRTVAGGSAAAEGQLALKPRAVPSELLMGLAIALRDDTLQVRANATSLTALVAPQACLSKSDLCDQVGNALIDNVNSRNALVRRAAMQALGQMRYSQSVQALSDQFSYYQKGLDAVAALDGLAGIGDSTSASVFRQLLTSGNADMRRLAVEGLARAGDREALKELHRIGQTERSSGVLLALHYANIRLGAAGDSLSQLVTALSNASQRPVAVKYLLDVAPATASALTAYVRDQSPDIRRLVADILGFSRDTRVTAALDAAAKDPDPDVALAARRAIERLKLP